MKLLNRFAYIYIYQSNLKLLLNFIVNKTCQSWQAQIADKHRFGVCLFYCF